MTRTWRQFLRTGLMATSAGLCFLSAGWADDVDQTAPIPETVVVTGQRAADVSAIRAKRDATQIVDSITAQDIGHMADFSVGDALKRIVGVNVYTYQGEPRFASLRGFDSHYFTTTLDGLQIASPDNQNQTNGGGRQFYLETLPSSIASRIEVFKTATPDMDGHALGGSLNFAIPSAFDFAEDQTSLSLKGGMEVLAPHYGGSTPTYDGEVFLTRTFGAAHQLGVTVSASLWHREMWIPQAETGSGSYWYTAAGKNSGTPYSSDNRLGTERRWYFYDDIRERKSVLAKIDWQPQQSLRLAWTNFYFTQHETSIRNDDLVSIGSSAVASDMTADSGTVSPRSTANASDITHSYRLYDLYFTRQIYGTQLTSQIDLGDQWLGEVKFGYSHSNFHNPQISNYFVQNGLSFDYRNTSDGVILTPVNATAYANLSAYVAGSTASNPQYYVEQYNTKGNLFEGKAHVAYNMDARDPGLGFEFGASAIRNDHSEGYSKTYWNGMPYTLADVAATKTLCDIHCNGVKFILIDDNKVKAELNKYLGAVTGVVDTADAYLKAFDIEEDVYAGYATARWRSDDWSIVGGLRFEQTKMNTDGYKAVTRKNVTTYVPATATAEYGHILPSLTATYDLNTDLKIRASYNRTLGRPKFTDMALMGGKLDTTSSSTPTLTTGNPDLLPRTANNFDLSTEWYFDDAKGMLSLGLFHKQIKHEIYSLSYTGQIDVGGGEMQSGIITQAVNSPYVTRVQGLEISLVKYFDFLPDFWSHFGVNGNATFTDAKFPLRLADDTAKTLGQLPNQPKFVSNLCLFYEDGPFSGRIAWNHTGTYIEERYIGNGTASASYFYRMRYAKPTDMIDASLSYDLDQRITLRLDANNLLGEGVDTNTGLNQEIPTVRMRIPTAYMAGIAVKW